MTSAPVRDPLADQRSPLAGVHSMDRALLVKIAVSRQVKDVATAACLQRSRAGSREEAR